MDDDYNNGGYSPGVPEGQAASPPKKVTKNMLLLPVTIRQLTQAQTGVPDDHFRIDGRELGHVTFVGVIRSVSESETNLSYEVEDGTGMIEVREWISRDESEYTAQKRASRREGLYVRVVGQLKTYHDKKHVTAFNLRAVEDFNEITHHFLEVIHAHLYNTKGPIPAGLAPQKLAAKPSNMGVNQAAHHQAHAPQAGGDRMQQLSENILEIIQARRDQPEGVGITEIYNVLHDVATFDEVKKTLMSMAENLHIYTTKDDDHFTLVN